MGHYLRSYDGAIPPEMCDAMVEMIDRAIREERSAVTKYDADWRKCHQLFFPCGDMAESGAIFEGLKPVLKTYLQRYMDDTGAHDAKHCTRVEVPSVLRYQPKEGRFNYHSDTFCPETATRQISVIAYLNDVAEGGCTIFPRYDVKISPVKGRLALFPSSWTHMHYAEPPLSDPKYAMVTWYHFPQANPHGTYPL